MDIDVIFKHLTDLAHRSDQCWVKHETTYAIPTLEKAGQVGILFSNSQERMSDVGTCGRNPSNWEAEAEGSQVQSHPVHVLHTGSRLQSLSQKEQKRSRVKY